MQVTKIEIGKTKARELYRAYKTHQHYSEPIDWEIQRTYQLLAQGKVVIQALESIKRAGLDDKGLPKLALAAADAKQCVIRRDRGNGSLIMSWNSDSWRQWAVKKKMENFAPSSFTFPAETFEIYEGSNNQRYYRRTQDHRAIVPIIPKHLRPRRAIENYHILFEAEWERIPPRDPYLLRRIGKGDLWLVCAAWDLTEVERAAMATRVSAA